MARPVHISRLVPHPANVREQLGDLTELTASIRAQGILQPLVAEPRSDGKYTLLAGHRRLAAAKRAGMEMVPVTIRRSGGPGKAIEVMLVENCQRRDLGPIEKAEAMGHLRDLGYTQTAIARAIGMTVSTVSNYLAYLDLDETTRQRVRSGTVKADVALRAVRRTRKATRGTTMGRPVHVEPPWFTRRHPLAAAAQALCDHTDRQIYGTVACGQCWEQAIRDDALTMPDDLEQMEETPLPTARQERMAAVASLRLATGPIVQPGEISAAQAAERIGVSARTIERYKHDLTAAGAP